MTIRDWFGKRRSPPKRRTGVRARNPGVVTPDPPQPPQPDDVAEKPATEPSVVPPDEPVAETILVAVRDAGEPGRGRADLTDDLGKAQHIVQGLVESGVKPEAVTALRATEVPLKVSYQWTVEISNLGEQAPAQGPQELAAQRVITRAAPGPETHSRTPVVASAGGTKGGVLTRASELLQEITPEAPFQLRFDRVVWLGLWGASLLILGLLLVASLSGGNAREFVIGQPSPLGSESTGSNVTARPTSAPSVSPGVSASPSAGAPAPLPSCLQGTVNNCQCQDFATYGEAQKFFSAYPPPNRQTVDPDGDGFYCEWLPKVSPSPGR